MHNKYAIFTRYFSSQLHALKCFNCIQTEKAKPKNGFTLIELMIVIAIIAILISLAIPRYANYTVRSRVTEGLTLAAGTKIGVAEYVMATGTWPDNNATAGLPNDISSKYVDSIVISASDNGGLITISYNLENIPELDGNNVLAIEGVEENGSINWDCRNSATTIPSNYLAPECRP